MLHHDKWHDQLDEPKHLRDSGLLSQMDAVLIIDRICEGGQNKHIGDLGLTKD